MENLTPNISGGQPDYTDKPTGSKKSLIFGIIGLLVLGVAAYLLASGTFFKGSIREIQGNNQKEIEKLQPFVTLDSKNEKFNTWPLESKKETSFQINEQENTNILFWSDKLSGTWRVLSADFAVDSSKESNVLLKDLSSAQGTDIVSWCFNFNGPLTGGNEVKSFYQCFEKKSELFEVDFKNRPDGQYKAILVIKDADGRSDSIEKKIEVKKSLTEATKETLVIACSAVVDGPKATLTDNSTFGTKPLKNAPWKWQWDFGDGEKSTEQNPVHDYKLDNKETSYTVKLTATLEGHTKIESSGQCEVKIPATKNTGNANKSTDDKNTTKTDASTKTDTKTKAEDTAKTMHEKATTEAAKKSSILPNFICLEVVANDRDSYDVTLQDASSSTDSIKKVELVPSRGKTGINTGKVAPDRLSDKPFFVKAQDLDLEMIYTAFTEKDSAKIVTTFKKQCPNKFNSKPKNENDGIRTSVLDAIDLLDTVILNNQGPSKSNVCVVANSGATVYFLGSDCANKENLLHISKVPFTGKEYMHELFPMINKTISSPDSYKVANLSITVSPDATCEAKNEQQVDGGGPDGAKDGSVKNKQPSVINISIEDKIEPEDPNKNTIVNGKNTLIVPENKPVKNPLIAKCNVAAIEGDSTSFYFDGSGSTGDILTGTWDFGDGQKGIFLPGNEATQKLYHKYLQSGNFGASLKISSKDGKSDTCAMPIKIETITEVDDETDDETDVDDKTDYKIPPQTACSDFEDNDADDLIDIEDPGCENSQDNDEYNAPKKNIACSDKKDNDSDGLIDMKDPGCDSSADNDEKNYEEIISSTYVNLPECLEATGKIKEFSDLDSVINRYVVEQESGTAYVGDDEENYGKTIFEGYKTKKGDRIFKPFSAIRRDEAIKTVMLTTCYFDHLDATDRLSRKVIPFKDKEFDDPGYWAADFIYAATNAGLVEEKNRFYPSDEVTRAEYLKLLLETYADITNNVIPQCYKGQYIPFVDVDTSDWFCKYAVVAKDLGISAGFEDAKGYLRLNPNKVLTRSDAAIMLWNYYVATTGNSFSENEKLIQKVLR